MSAFGGNLNNHRCGNSKKIKRRNNQELNVKGGSEVIEKEFLLLVQSVKTLKTNPSCLFSYKIP